MDTKGTFIGIDPKSYFEFYDKNGNGKFDLYEDKIKFGPKVLNEKDSVEFLKNLMPGGINGKLELTSKYMASLLNSYLAKHVSQQKETMAPGPKQKPVGAIHEEDLFPKFEFSGESLKDGLEFYIKPYWSQYQLNKFITKYPNIFILKTYPVGCYEGRRRMCWPASAELSAMVFLVELPEPLKHMKMLVTSPMLSASLKDHAFPIEIYGYVKSGMGLCQKFTKMGNNSYTSYKGLFKELYFKGYKFVDPKKHGEACKYKPEQTGGSVSTWNLRLHGR